MRYLYLLAVLLLAPSAVVAQASGAAAAGAPTNLPNTVFGLKGNLTRTDLQSASNYLFSSPFDMAIGWSIGGYGRHQFTSFAAVQTELLYSRNTFKGDGYNRPPGSAPPSNRLTYLALPILFVGTVTKHLYFHVGPQAAVLLAAQRDEQALSLRQSSYQRFDVGGVAGVEVQSGLARLGLRAAYSLPLLNQVGTAVTTTGQALQVLAPDNTYHQWLLQGYLSVDLVCRR